MPLSGAPTGCEIQAWFTTRHWLARTAARVVATCTLKVAVAPAGMPAPLVQAVIGPGAAQTQPGWPPAGAIAVRPATLGASKKVTASFTLPGPALVTVTW